VGDGENARNCERASDQMSFEQSFLAYHLMKKGEMFSTPSLVFIREDWRKGG
jgi:hypothetical protein